MVKQLKNKIKRLNMNKRESTLEFIGALNAKMNELLAITIKMAELGIANESNQLFKNLMLHLDATKEMIYELEKSLYQ